MFSINRNAYGEYMANLVILINLWSHQIIWFPFDRILNIKIKLVLLHRQAWGYDILSIGVCLCIISYDSHLNCYALDNKIAVCFMWFIPSTFFLIKVYIYSIVLFILWKILCPDLWPVGTKKFIFMYSNTSKEKVFGGVQKYELCIIQCLISLLANMLFFVFFAIEDAQ